MATLQHFRELDPLPGSVGDVFRLIRSDIATTRSALARKTGLSPSTVGLRVEALQRLGLIAEDGEHRSEGGRRARLLRIVADNGHVVAIESGVRYLQVLVADLEGNVLGEARHDGVLELAPREAISAMWERIGELREQIGGASVPLRGVVVSVPAPVDYATGRIATPSYMPKWHGASIVELFSTFTDAPVLVENDANLIALSELPARGHSRENLLAVLLGTRIGSGIIANGQLLRGENGAAGELSHTPVNAEPTIACVCGLESCLESAASGAAVASRLKVLGHDVRSMTDIAILGRGGDPEVLAVLRDAGTLIGSVLASSVNFINPRSIVLGGIMSTSAPLVAAIRAELFQKCLPIASEGLEVRAIEAPETAASRGAFRLLLDEVLAPARVDHLARQADAAAQIA
ncbi:ROK family protein [Promicromonospora sp. Populi]|uniref:ROK family transcriptional regulator n=1 Tax=Promicromonospora sp. Populi TaxID=3239420 RepID=UPI0034E1A277